MIAPTIHRAGAMCAGVCLWISSAADAAGRPFSFARDTFAFGNETLFEYHQGHASLRREDGKQENGAGFRDDRVHKGCHSLVVGRGDLCGCNGFSHLGGHGEEGGTDVVSMEFIRSFVSA